MNKQKIIHIEFLRILAIYLVMFNHTSLDGYFHFSVAQDSVFWPLYFFMTLFDRIDIYLFFMITGALLLGKEESYKKIGYRIARIVLVLLISKLVWLIYSHFVDGTAITLKNYFEWVFSGNAPGHLWYLYNYMGILLMLPILRKVVKTMKSKDFVYVAICHLLLTGVIPYVQYWIFKGEVSFAPSFSAAIFTTSNIVFCLEGYFIENVLDKKYFTGKVLICAIILSLMALMLTAMVTLRLVHNTGICNEASSQVFFDNLVLIPAMTVYFGAKRFFEGRDFSEKFRTLITKWGGVCVWDILIRRRVQNRNTPFFPIFTTLSHHHSSMPCLAGSGT